MSLVKVELDFSLPAWAGVSLTSHQQAVLQSDASALLMQGAAGTGKSLLLEQFAIASIKEKKIKPESILLIAFSRQQAKQIRNRLAFQLMGDPMPRITTFHSFAFGIVQQVVTQDTELEVFENIKLLSGPEQESRLNELLVNAIKDKEINWPEELKAAVGTYGLTHQVRNLLARVRALGMDPAELSQLGQLYQNPLWIELGKFGEMYLDVLDSQNLIDYAEVIHRASLYLSQSEYQKTITPKLDLVLVDEYQDIDPAQVRLLKALHRSGVKIVCAGDENSSIYQFRGADSKAIFRFKEDFTNSKIENLIENHRKTDNFKQEINSYQTVSIQTAHIIAKIRELRIKNKLNWSDIAIIGRGTESLNFIYRHLIRADIPAELAEIENPIYQDSAVKVILDLIELSLKKDYQTDADVDLIIKILQSPLINYSKLDLRKTVKQIRDLSETNSEDVPNSEQAILKAFLNHQLLLEIDHHGWGLRKLSGLVLSVKDLTATGASIYSIIWQVYSERALDKYLTLFQIELPDTPWHLRLQQQALGGTKETHLANRALDSILSLFDMASREDENASAGRDIASFINEIKIQQFAQETIAQKPQKQAVQLLTAHSTKGREWRAVFVVDLQEGVWPSGRLRNTLLEAERLDTAGYARSFSRIDLINEERRLFQVAQNRAKDYLSLSCIKNDYEDKSNPSQFLYEILDSNAIEEINVPPEGFSSLNELIVKFRKILIDENISEDFKKAVAIRISSLIETKDGFGNLIVENLRPENWWGVDPPQASDAPLRDKNLPIKVSASKLQSLEDCSLRWFLDTDGGASLPRAEFMSVGSIVHALAHAIAKEQVKPEFADISSYLETIWPQIKFEADWISLKEKSNVETMIQTLINWHTADRDRRVVAVEESFHLQVNIAEENDTIEIRGMIDRIEAASDDASAIHIVDLKTSKKAPSAPKTLTDPQLAAYRMAVDEGALGELLPKDAKAVGAELVQLRDTAKGKARVLNSAPVEMSGINELLKKAIKVIRDESVTATICNSCRICAYKKICPAQSEGQSVI
jgi:superfamily I DNA/RNA helicase/RecB family exonuclease